MTRRRNPQQDLFKVDRGPDTESWSVGEISNMFDILPIHCDELGNYNQS